MEINRLLRKNIARLEPYSCARDEFKGEASVYLDANENPYNGPFNRYPDPLQLEVKSKISQIKAVPVENIFLGNGSDEPIDLMFRAFCEPRIDNVVAIEPTYGMLTYEINSPLVSRFVGHIRYNPHHRERDTVIIANLSHSRTLHFSANYRRQVPYQRLFHENDPDILIHHKPFINLNHQFVCRRPTSVYF